MTLSERAQSSLHTRAQPAATYLRPDLRKHVRPVLTYPFSGSSIPKATQLKYVRQLRQAQKDMPLFKSSQPAMDQTPAEAWSDHPMVVVKDGRCYAKSQTGEKSLGQENKCLTTLFPAFPQRYLAGENGETIWPFHIIPWRFEPPQIPDVVATNENGVRIVSRPETARIAVLILSPILMLTTRLWMTSLRSVTSQASSPSVLNVFGPCQRE